MSQFTFDLQIILGSVIFTENKERAVSCCGLTSELFPEKTKRKKRKREKENRRRKKKSIRIKIIRKLKKWREKIHQATV